VGYSEPELSAGSEPCSTKEMPKTGGIDIELQNSFRNDCLTYMSNDKHTTVMKIGPARFKMQPLKIMSTPEQKCTIWPE
jgi:hypothetical protein